MEYFKYEKEGIVGKADIKASADTVMEGTAVILLQLAAASGGKLSVKDMLDLIEKKYIAHVVANMAATEEKIREMLREAGRAERSTNEDK